MVFSYRLVIETLKDVDPDRKCFRLVGGVLVERTVKEVQPALINNREQVSKWLPYQQIFGKTSFVRSTDIMNS